MSTALHCLTRTPAGLHRTVIASNLTDDEARQQFQRWERLRMAGEVAGEVVGFEVDGNDGVQVVAGDTKPPVDTRDAPSSVQEHRGALIQKGLFS